MNLTPDGESVNCRGAFVKQNTALDYRNDESPTPPLVVMMVEIQLSLS